MAGKELIEQGEKRREAILDFIRAYTAEHGYSPTTREIGDAVGIVSPNAVRNHLVRLRDEGLITMQPRTARSVRAVEEPVG